MPEAVTIAEAADILKGCERILILTHERPDGDALGSTLGMQAFLRGCGKRADACLPVPPPAKYRSLIGDWKASLTPDEIAEYDLILLLDCATPERIAAGDAVDSVELSLRQEPPVLNIDHHMGNSVNAIWNLVQADAAAASEMAAAVAMAMGCPIPVEAATLWLLGIVTDTGAFRFSNTIGNTLRISAGLLDCGADLERIVNAAYYSKPFRQQQFEAEMIQTRVRIVLGGRYIYAFIPDALFEKYGFDMRDGEGLIEVLREVEGTVVAALIYRKGNTFKVSLRSKDLRFPVGPLARSLGGGGHEMAAGATLENMTKEEVEPLLTAKVAELFEHPRNPNHKD